MRSVSPIWTIKNSIIALAYALKAATVAWVALQIFDFDRTEAIALGMMILGICVPDLLVIATLAMGGGAALQSRRLLALTTEFGVAAGLIVLGLFHASRGGRGDEVGHTYWAFAMPIFFLALMNLIPFDGENPDTGAPSRPDGRGETPA